MPGLSGWSQSAPHPHTNAPEHFSPGAHSPSLQQTSGMGVLQTLLTHGIEAKSPQSMSVSQQPGARSQTYWLL